MNAAQLQGGKAVCPRPRRSYTPKEASALLAEWGIFRSEKWFWKACKNKRVRTLPAFSSGRYQVPEEELFRLAGIKDQAEPEGAS